MAQRPLLPWNWRRENVGHPLAHGWAEVKATGQVIIHDPPPGGRPARLRVDPRSQDRLHLTVNGIEQHGDVTVRAFDAVVVRAEASPAQASFNVIVRRDGLVASLTAHYEAGVRVTLDATPSGPLTVLSAVIEMEAPTPIQAASVLQEMDRLGIRTGVIDEADLQDILDQLEPVQIVAAQGVPPQVPTGEKFVPSHALLDLPWQEYPRGVVVEADTLLGTVVPAAPAAPGEDVYGRPIPSGEYTDDPRLPMHGPIRAEEDSSQLFAEVAGRVLWSPDDVRVIPITVLTPQSLAALPSQTPLWVPGDAIIQGDLKYQALAVDGYVTIKGSVTGSVIAAGVGLTVQGRTRDSHLAAGLGEQAAQDLQDHLIQWRDVLQDLLTMMQEVRKEAPQAAVMPPGRLLNKLIDLRHPEWDAMTAWVADALTSPFYRIVPGRLAHLRALAAFIAPASLEAMATEDALRSLVERLSGPMPAEAEPVWTNPEDSRSMYLGQVQAGTVRCGGDLTLRDAWKSTIEARGAVTVLGSVAGGVIVAGKTVDAEEIGNRAHLETSVKVLDAEGQVSARRLFANAVVQVARVRRRLHQDVQELIIDGIETPR